MAVEPERLGKEYWGDGHRVRGGFLWLQASITSGVQKFFPENGKKSEKTTLEAEWQRQAQNLANLFAEELKFETPEAYIATLPKFEAQKENWKGRFDIPVIVERRVPLKRMLELSGIAVPYLDVDLIKDWEKGQFKTPETPYSAWLSDGYSNLGKSVDMVRKSLQADERGGNIYDVIALCLSNPKILDYHYLDIPGSQVDSDSAPFLIRWRGERPKLDHVFTGFADPHFGSVVAGKL